MRRRTNEVFRWCWTDGDKTHFFFRSKKKANDWRPLRIRRLGTGNGNVKIFPRLREERIIFKCSSIDNQPWRSRRIFSSHWHSFIPISICLPLALSEWQTGLRWRITREKNPNAFLDVRMSCQEFRRKDTYFVDVEFFIAGGNLQEKKENQYSPLRDVLISHLCTRLHEKCE